MTEAIIESVKGGAIGWLIFKNTKRKNAVSYEMWLSIPDKIDSFADDPEIRAIIVRGFGEDAFISGADISQFEQVRGSKADVADYDVATRRANEAILKCGKPTIAMIHGYCIGGGLGVALCCDLRFAAADAKFAIPAARLGLGYPYEGVKLLVDVVGPGYAKEIFYTARQFDAGEALAMGLVNRVFPNERLLAETVATSKRIAQNAPLTISAAKTAVAAVQSPDAEAAADFVAAAVARCFASEDYKEGRRAFSEKRSPQFTGS